MKSRSIHSTGFAFFAVPVFLAFWAILAVSQFVLAAQVSAEEIPSLADLNPKHPRIYMTDAQCAETAALLKTDANLQKLYAIVEKEAEGYLKSDETVGYIIIGPRLLTQSRRCLRRVLALGTVYRLSEDAEKRTACRERAMAEIRAAAAFPDWNPSHFLDTAEMTAAFAIAYDWFYADLTQDERKMIEDAIYEKAIVPGLQVKGGWKKSAYNWNQVCNGGLAMGALAIADAVTDPEKKAAIEKTVVDGVKSVGIAMKSFAPDGAWAEGPAYWCYTTLYTLFYIEALESALGSDFGVADFEGFDKTGDSLIALADPQGRSFNFADAGSGIIAHSQLMWFANRYGRPEWTQFYLNYRKDIYPTAVWYYRPAKADMTKVPLDFSFRDAEIATFRSSWTDPNAWFVGFKAGGNAVNHSHLELGAFILNHDSVRWAVDLGADNYNLPGYFGKKRWTYYRLATRGQNTLCVDGMNQNTKAACRIEDFTSTPAAGSAWTDLTQAYAGQLAYARRKVCLDREKSCVTLRDEIGPGTESTIGKPLVWQFHTRAKIEISPDGKTAVLTQNAGKEEKKLCVSLEKCTASDARFEELATTPGPDENQNSGIRRLAVKVPVTDGPQEIQVRFSGNQP